MTESNWTKGPWSVIPRGPNNEYRSFYVVDLYGARFPHGRFDGIAETGPLVLRPEAEANARLIAAAPDLAEACEAAEMFMRDVGSQSKALELVRAALRKAKGEA